MGSALVVGDRGSGLTTFLGLLYAAEVRLGTEESDEFRFSADRETIRRLEAIYGELVAGRFPQEDTDWEEHPIAFVLAYRQGGRGLFGGPGSDGQGEFRTVSVRVGGMPAAELSELLDHDAVLSDTTRRLLRSPIVIPLVDASRLRPSSDAHVPPELIRYDRGLSRTFALLASFLAAERRRRARVLHPLFVVTKFDRLPAEARSELAVPEGPLSSWPEGTGEEVGARILKRFLPETERSMASAAEGKRVKVETPHWFYSSLELAPGTEPPRIVRRSRVPIAGWEPSYPFEEYKRLVHRIAELAGRTPSSTVDGMPS